MAGAETRDLAGEVTTHRHTARRVVAFREIRLDLAAAGGWAAGTCRLIRADGGETAFACTVLSAVSAGDARFQVTIDDGSAARHDPFEADGLVTGFPSGADCFLFRREDDGLWHGVTIATAGARIVVTPFACDPA